MRDRDYINSIWSKRDEAFFWYGRRNICEEKGFTVEYGIREA